MSLRASFELLVLYDPDQLFVFLLCSGKGQEYWEEENINEEMPACRLMFNIFHPFDPVAYRSSWPLPSDANIKLELFSI